MKRNRFDVLMLDLDGTLLKIDMNSFIRNYVASMAAYFASVINPEVFSRHLLASTRVMINNRDKNHTNEEIFFQDISARLNLSRQEIRCRIDRFYEEEYPRLRCWASPHPLTPRLIRTAQKKGMDLVLATNPVFPLQGIQHRLEWADLPENIFILITTYENMHYCKPHAEYYLEILEKIQKEPSSCLMAGNDASEDLVAGSLGIGTFLVEDHVIISPDHVPVCDHRGKLKDLINFIETI